MKLSILTILKKNIDSRTKNRLKLNLYKFIRAYKNRLSKITKKSANYNIKKKFKGKFKVKTFDKKSFYLYNAPFNLETNIFWKGIDNFTWEKMTRKIWIQLCSNSTTILDIGSNSGIFATLAKVYNPSAKVVAFEPQPNIFEVLKKNNEINSFDIKCENLALSNEEGLLPFYNYGGDTFSSQNTTAGSLNKNWRPKDQSYINVTVKKLDNYIIDNHIKKVDLIKIDVETLEYRVLLGYKKHIYKHQPIIVLEIQENCTAKNIASLFKRSEYSFFEIDEKRGLKRLEKLEPSENNLNFLICPNSKLNYIEGLTNNI